MVDCPKPKGRFPCNQFVQEYQCGTAFDVAVDAYRDALDRFDCPRGLYATAAALAVASGENRGVWISEPGDPVREAATAADVGRPRRKRGKG